MLSWLKDTKVLRCRVAKVKKHIGTKAQRCNTALYNGLVPHNGTVLLNGMVQPNGAVLLYGLAWHSLTA